MRRRLKVLEIGSYIAPAFAGLLLSEAGHDVEKWTAGRDPIRHLTNGDSLWHSINRGKRVVERMFSGEDIIAHQPEVVIDNFLPETLTRIGVDPKGIAERLGAVWISIRSDIGGRSFDLLAQARSVANFCGHIPFYIGDTGAGLWAAHAATSAIESGHYVVGQASALAKLVEGDLPDQKCRSFGDTIPWINDEYRIEGDHAIVEFKGEIIREPIRDYAWKRENLWHENGVVKPIRRQ